MPALAACALVGWWAGGRAFLAIAWVALAVALIGAAPTRRRARSTIWRAVGVCCSPASFGLVCLFVHRRGRFFTRALAALGITLVLARSMSLRRPGDGVAGTKTVADEFARRNAETMATFNAFIETHPKEWSDLVAKFPQIADAAGGDGEAAGVNVATSGRRSSRRCWRSSRSPRSRSPGRRTTACVARARRAAAAAARNSASTTSSSGD